MLGYIILAALQFAAAFTGAPYIKGVIGLSPGGMAENFITATIAAIIIWIVGVVSSLIIKDVRMPASSTLISTLVGSLIGCALVTVPAIIALFDARAAIGGAPAFYWIAGGIIGYMLRR